MTRQRLHIISALVRSCVVSQFFEISFVTVTTLNLYNLIYGGKKIRMKTFISRFLFKQAGEAWHFHFNVDSCRQSACPACPVPWQGAAGCAESPGDREPRVLLLRATYFISLPLLLSHPLLRC